MSLPLYVHGRSDVGRTREINEDVFRVEALAEGGWLLVVCDGMGGHDGGEIASATASEVLVRALRDGDEPDPRKRLYDGLRGAHAAVLAASEEHAVPGMGTTGVAAWVGGDRFWCGWVGDSRLYQLRGGTILERTEDHTRVRAMVAQGILDAAAARHHPDAHVLVRALGCGPDGDATPEVWGEPIELQPGDVLLLCSDGLYDLLEDDELYPLVAGLPCDAAVDRLVDEANARGGHDNVTVVILVAGQPTIPAIGAPAARAAAPPIAVRTRWIERLAIATIGLGIGFVTGFLAAR